VKLLFDTHAFLWWATDPDRLPGAVLEMVQTVGTEVYLSAASSWEVEIKAGLGKLELVTPWQTIVEREVVRNGFQLLPITFAHTYKLGALPPIHRDPFDRILIAQSLSDGMKLVSVDAKLRDYPDISVLWD